ncbi:hypothetical protein [Streptomyces sp. NRRL F-5123]|uniref:hypothetical protein n=1 Tax=Streptomyces sp. NRRL F-5123 TaxID=1463856 RepID=UPI0004E26576|nr:hypothetical protein [Streptomyces sp. NRRL F-5123]
MREDWECLREPGLVHVVITAGDAASAYRVFDALVDCFPAVEPPASLGAPPGLVSLAFLAPTRTRHSGHNGQLRSSIADTELPESE